MKPWKFGSFADRQAASVEAKKALVGQIQVQADRHQPNFEERRAAA